MLKTMIVLPDGKEISSGMAGAAITAATFTQCVNDLEDLSLGSVCANLLEVELLDKEQTLYLQQGDEIRLVKIGEDGHQYPMGFFTLEKPIRPTANTLRLTAYDRITWLDKDLTEWLAGLQEWPYSLHTFARMVCDACGLELANTSLPNGNYQVQAFHANGVTGRKLMQWVGEIAGRFCRATTEGQLEFAWYTPSGVTLTPGGDRWYFQNGLTYQDYQVAPIEKVQIRLSQEDVGVVWPDVAGEKNTYILSGNYLLTTTDTETLQPVAQTLYEMLKPVTYTPCTLTIPACTDIRAGNTVDITDRNGKTVTAYVMRKVQRGQAETLECTGSHRRDSTEVMNNEEYRTRNSRQLELVKQAEGLSVRALQTQTDLHALTESVADMQLKAGELSARVSQMDSTTGTSLDSVNDSLQTLQKEVSAKMTPEAVELRIRSAMEDGTTRVTTDTGFTFDENGLQVEKAGSEMRTRITENGMTVYQNSAQVLTADNKGVDAKNLHATTYLIVGGRSRFENYGSDRTGCFWIGG